MRTGLAIDAVAARFFSPNECSALAAIAPELRCEAFFFCWTRKEQISRRGVMACRNSTSLSFPERNRGAGMILPRQIAALHAFNLGHGCKGALAIEGSRLKLTSPADLP